MPVASTKTRPITVTLPRDVIQRVKEIARSEDRSFSNSLAQLVRRAAAVETQELVTSKG
jgi:hypothetical protein